jgi:hypothetical protein
MALPTRAKQLIYRGAAGRNTRRGFPRWIAIPFILIIGWILWIGVLSDSSDVASTLYVATVIGAALLFAYVDRKRNI